jgi:integrase
MARPTSKVIYYEKAFQNARRCLDEAVKNKHPSAKNIIRLKHPSEGVPIEVMDIEFAIDWCINNHLPEWSQGTWRMLRCGYRDMLARLVKAGRMSESRANELNERMHQVSGLKRKDRVKKTSSRRKKVALPEHIDQIDEYVSKKGAKWGEALVIWLRAAIVTGLRPNEWQTARLVENDGKVILISENFKHNDERSYGPEREIDLTNIPGEYLRNVRSQLSIVKGFMERDQIEKYYKGCSSLLYECNKKIWPHRKANLNLYTGRHQFSANAKAELSVSDVERAAMMGHKTTKTSSQRYGRTKSGKKGLSPQIANEDVLKLVRDDGSKVAWRPGENSPSLGKKND